MTLAAIFLFLNIFSNYKHPLFFKQQHISSVSSCGKILRENLVGKSCWKICGKILWENLAGKSCGKFLSEKLLGKSCGKILWEILVGNSCGTRSRVKSQFSKGSVWWKFSIWNRVMGTQPIRIQLGKILWENFAGKSCRKFLSENLVGKSCGKILWENLAGKSCWKFLRENLAACKGPRNGKKCQCQQFLAHFLPFLALYRQ